MRYVFESKNFSGELIFEFDDAGLLKQFTNKASLDKDMITYLIGSFPMHLSILQAIAKKSKESRLLELPDVIDFESFYNAYGRKEGKTPALRAWEKLSDDEQKRAFRYIARYDSILSQEKWRSKLMPATYLNQKKWLD